jgi:hypothetical protein
MQLRPEPEMTLCGESTEHDKWSKTQREHIYRRRDDPIKPLRP